MEIPKVFLLNHKKEIGRSKTKIPMLGLENLIFESIDGINCDERTVTRLLDSYLPKHPLNKLGIKNELVKRIALTKYEGYLNIITLVEYEKKSCLLDNLNEISKKGADYFDHNSCWSIKFAERVLFKDNILIYLEGEESFTKKAAEHYKNAGFEQLDC